MSAGARGRSRRSDLPPRLGEPLSRGGGALGGHEDDVADVVGAAIERPLEDGMQLDRREHGAVRLHEGARDLRASAGDRADHVRGDDAARVESLAHQLDELQRRQVERHAVGVEGVDHDHVVALVVALQEASAVVDLDREARVARQLEPAVRGRHDLGIELDGRDLQVVEVAPHALWRGCAAEPDDEDLLRVRACTPAPGGGSRCRGTACGRDPRGTCRSGTSCRSADSARSRPRRRRDGGSGCHAPPGR